MLLNGFIQPVEFSLGLLYPENHLFFLPDSNQKFLYLGHGTGLAL